MVKRSRDQSQEAPRRFSWLTMVPPLSAFHVQTFSTNFSRPSSRRSGCWRSSSWRSTTICVAMPAWSVPGCHSTSLPRMRSKRHEHVLQRVVERVPHVQRARHVRRRDDDAVGLAALARSGRPALKASALIQSSWMRGSMSAGW